MIFCFGDDNESCAVKGGKFLSDKPEDVICAEDIFKYL